MTKTINLNEAIAKIGTKNISLMLLDSGNIDCHLKREGSEVSIYYESSPGAKIYGHDKVIVVLLFERKDFECL